MKVKVGIPESFKVGWYSPKKAGSSHLKFGSNISVWPFRWNLLSRDFYVILTLTCDPTRDLEKFKPWPLFDNKWMWFEFRKPIACGSYNLYHTIIIRFRAMDACLFFDSSKVGGGGEWFGLIGARALFRNGALIYFCLESRLESELPYSLFWSVFTVSKSLMSLSQWCLLLEWGDVY